MITQESHESHIPRLMPTTYSNKLLESWLEKNLPLTKPERQPVLSPHQQHKDQEHLCLQVQDITEDQHAVSASDTSITSGELMDADVSQASLLVNSNSAVFKGHHSYHRKTSGGLNMSLLDLETPLTPNHFDRKYRSSKSLDSLYPSAILVPIPIHSTTQPFPPFSSPPEITSTEKTRHSSINLSTTTHMLRIQSRKELTTPSATEQSSKSIVDAPAIITANTSRSFESSRSSLISYRNPGAARLSVPNSHTNFELNTSRSYDSSKSSFLANNISDRAVVSSSSVSSSKSLSNGSRRSSLASNNTSGRSFVRSIKPNSSMIITPAASITINQLQPQSSKPPLPLRIQIPANNPASSASASAQVPAPLSTALASPKREKQKLQPHLTPYLLRVQERENLDRSPSGRGRKTRYSERPTTPTRQTAADVKNEVNCGGGIVKVGQTQPEQQQAPLTPYLLRLQDREKLDRSPSGRGRKTQYSERPTTPRYFERPSARRTSNTGGVGSSGGGGIQIGPIAIGAILTPLERRRAYSAALKAATAEVESDPKATTRTMTPPLSNPREADNIHQKNSIGAVPGAVSSLRDANNDRSVMASDLIEMRLDKLTKRVEALERRGKQ